MPLRTGGMSERSPAFPSPLQPYLSVRTPLASKLTQDSAPTLQAVDAALEALDLVPEPHDTEPESEHTPERAMILDAAAYPHILDGIFASASREALLALRSVNRAFQLRADALLVHHLALAVDPESRAILGAECIDATVSPLYAPVVPRRLPVSGPWGQIHHPDASFASHSHAVDMSEHVRILDFPAGRKLLRVPDWVGSLPRVHTIRAHVDAFHKSANVELPPCDVYVSQSPLPDIRTNRDGALRLVLIMDAPGVPLAPNFLRWVSRFATSQSELVLLFASSETESVYMGQNDVLTLGFLVGSALQSAEPGHVPRVTVVGMRLQSGREEDARTLFLKGLRVAKQEEGVRMEETMERVGFETLAQYRIRVGERQLELEIST